MSKRRAELLATAALSIALSLFPACGSARAGGLLAQLETELQKIAADISQSVVTIRAIRVGSRSGELREVYVGTGVVLDSGWIVTTPSVVAAGVSYSVQAPGQVPVPAELAAYHLERQIAVFRAPALIAPPARFDTSASLIPGQLLLVLGNAYGVEAAVSFGIVAGERDDGLWQVGVPITPGASGSPVVNTSGSVVGIVVAALSDPSGSPSVGVGTSSALMVPAVRGLPLARRMMREGSIGRAFLGVRPESMDAEVAQILGVAHGVLVAAVSFGSPADIAGLRPGDVILEMNRKPLVHEEGLRQLLADHCPGEQVEVTVMRSRQIERLEVQLGQIPEYLPERPAVPATGKVSSGPSAKLPPGAEAIEAEIRALQEQLDSLRGSGDGP